ncbi:MAG: DUF6515 family protein [Bacteroidota bacterium]
MKRVKMYVLALVLLGGLVSVNAQTRTVKVYPRVGTVVTTVQKPTVVVHRGVNFHFADGIWYRAQGRKFIVAAAPAGIRVRRLPRGHRVVRVNGRRLYNYRGIWYKKQGRGFVVVNV